MLMRKCGLQDCSVLRIGKDGIIFNIDLILCPVYINRIMSKVISGQILFCELSIGCIA